MGAAIDKEIVLGFRLRLNEEAFTTEFAEDAEEEWNDG
jgi:hypothetical protein